MTGRAMTCLFSAAGLAALRDFIDAGTLLAFDLDGTLAPIIADPDKIVIPDDVSRRLTALQKMAPVAVISGRSRADALTHLGFTPAYLAGNHGAEGLPGHKGEESGYVSLCSSWKKQLGTLLPDEEASGIVLEDKGATLTLHYRNSDNRERAHGEILNAIARLVPQPRSGSGKFVENIAPPAAPHKGIALLSIMAHLGCSRALFVGDDETDEDVFRLDDARILGIRVGMNVDSAASWCLSSQDEIGDLLDRIRDVIMSRASELSSRNGSRHNVAP